MKICNEMFLRHPNRAKQIKRVTAVEAKVTWDAAATTYYEDPIFADVYVSESWRKGRRRGQGKKKVQTEKDSKGRRANG